MRLRNLIVVFVFVLACAGCGKKKSTETLIGELGSAQEKDRVHAVRLLAQRTGDAGQTVPALIAALGDKKTEIRRSAVIGLGALGEKAKGSIPALQAAQRDRDARIREASRVALSRIDPQRFPFSGGGRGISGSAAR